TYRPSREYPLLSAGFAISYRINGIIPRLRTKMGQAQEDNEAPLDYAELANWL
ncbi:methyltransferase, partial [Paenibacillus popilliae ATCC 14706]